MDSTQEIKHSQTLDSPSKTVIPQHNLTHHFPKLSQPKRHDIQGKKRKANLPLSQPKKYITCSH